MMRMSFKYSEMSFMLSDIPRVDKRVIRTAIKTKVFDEAVFDIDRRRSRGLR